MTKRRCRVGIWIERRGRNGRTPTPTREGIVRCRPASHAGRERVWGSCGERGQTLGAVVAGLVNQARGLSLSFSFRSHPSIRTRWDPFLFSFDARVGQVTGGILVGRGQPLRTREERLTGPGAGPLPNWYVYKYCVMSLY